MKIQSLFVVSIICFFCATAFAESAATTEAAVTGLCKDGTPYTGKSKRGACRGHDGVKEWYADKVPAATSTPAAEPAPVAPPPPSTTSQAPSAAATGICNDGSEYTGASKRGACRGHKGVKEWFADKQAPTATAVATPKPAVEPTPAAGPAVIPPPPQPSAQPASVPAPAQTAPAPAAGSGKVWVNTKSKIYHCEGTKFYGHTKAGEYMSEADAIAKGNKANRNKACK